MQKNTVINEDFSWEKYTVTDVKAVYGKVETLINNYINEIKAIEDKELSFKNIFKAGDLLSADISKMVGILHIFEMVHGNKDIRDASRVEVIRISEILNNFSYNEDVYNKTKTYFDKNYKKNKKNLTKEEIKIVEDTMRSYKKMGMHLPKPKRDLLVKLNNKADKISSDFNLAATKAYEKGVWFSEEELKGVPSDVLMSFKYDDKTSKYFVSAFLRSQYRVVQKYALSKKTREKITKMYEQGVGDTNTKRLAEILKIRHEITKMLGYKTYADMAVTDQMVNKPTEARKFVENLAKNLSKRFSFEKKEAQKVLEKYGEKINTANILFAENIIQKEKVNLDLQELAEYFEYENTIKAMFDIWEKYFDVKATRIRDLKIFGPDVDVYSFKDAKSGEDMGTAIFDLFPRDGKYGHACVSSIAPRYFDSEGNVHTSTGILICNFTKNKSGKTLLNMESVSTLFHEGGHLLHKMLGKNNYTSTGSFSTSIDFVEIHSQFLENFATTKDAVNEVARHYKTGEKLPQHLFDKIEMGDDYFSGFMWTRQSVFSIFDLEIHGKNIMKYAKNPKAIDKLFNDLFKKYMGIPTQTLHKFASGFAHMTGGYSARYWGYSVSRVYAQDCWEEFAKGGIKIFGSKTKAYKTMLELGGTIKESDNLRKFLGRAPKQSAFLKSVNK